MFPTLPFAPQQHYQDQKHPGTGDLTLPPTSKTSSQGLAVPSCPQPIVPERYWGSLLCQEVSEPREYPGLLQLGIAVSRGRPVLRGEVLLCVVLAAGGRSVRACH